jgi:hypothetical protein
MMREFATNSVNTYMSFSYRWYRKGVSSSSTERYLYTFFAPRGKRDKRDFMGQFQKVRDRDNSEIFRDGANGIRNCSKIFETGHTGSGHEKVLSR